MAARGGGSRCAIPDLRGFTKACSPEALRELCDAFELEAVYHKEREQVRLTAVLSRRAAAIAGLLEQEPKRTGPPVGDLFHSGGGIRTRDLPVMSSKGARQSVFRRHVSCISDRAGSR